MTKGACAILLLMLVTPHGAAGRSGASRGQPHVLTDSIPFAAGETASYRVGWGIFGRAGGATLGVTRDTLNGRSVLHAVLSVRGGIPGARVTERLESWMDPATVASYRSLQHTRYPGFSRDRVRAFDAANLRWTGHTNSVPDSGALPTARPIDDLSAVFVARALRLTVGEDITLHDYWWPASNPIVLKVLRRETVEVPAGKYQTTVVRPIVRTSSLFAESGEAEVYISDGPRREVVMLRAKLKVGTLVLRLEKYAAGQ